MLEGYFQAKKAAEEEESVASLSMALKIAIQRKKRAIVA